MTNLDLTTEETQGVLIGRIAGLVIGATLPLPDGYVRRVKRTEYVLHANANKDRARWGTCKEIEEDTRFFLANKVLPKAQGGRW